MTDRDMLKRLIAGERLDRSASCALVRTLLQGQSPPALAGALLAALNIGGPTSEEIAGAVDALRADCPPVKAPPGALDTCGTGGDGLKTRNVSTTVAIVSAACGVVVAKHGNRSATSLSSSAGVLEAAGVAVDLPAPAIERCLDELGIGFMLANHFHPAMASTAEVRRALGVPTLFNLVGPLANPARVRRQVIGVFAARWIDPMAEALLALDAEHAWVVHGAGGMDELSLAGPSEVAEIRNGSIRRFTAAPAAAGLAEQPVAALAGGDATDNAAALVRLLEGERGAYRDTVILNTAAALLVAGRAEDLAEGADQAKRAIDGGAARARLDAWARLTQELAA